MASKVFALINKEAHRQKYGLEMIPSENYVSEDVLKANGSILTNKYSHLTAQRDDLAMTIYECITVKTLPQPVLLGLPLN